MLQESQKRNRVDQGIAYFKHLHSKIGYKEIYPTDMYFDMRRVLESVDWNAKLVANVMIFVLKNDDDKSWRNFYRSFKENAELYLSQKQDIESRKKLLERTVHNK